MNGPAGRHWGQRRQPLALSLRTCKDMYAYAGLHLERIGAIPQPKDASCGTWDRDDAPLYLGGEKESQAKSGRWPCQWSQAGVTYHNKTWKTPVWLILQLNRNTTTWVPTAVAYPKRRRSFGVRVKKEHLAEAQLLAKKKSVRSKGDPMSVRAHLKNTNPAWTQG